jgi:hypothetical protein
VAPPTPYAPAVDVQLPADAVVVGSAYAPADGYTVVVVAVCWTLQ